VIRLSLGSASPPTPPLFFGGGYQVGCYRLVEVIRLWRFRDAFSGSGFRVSGLPLPRSLLQSRSIFGAFSVSVFGFRVSGFEFQVSGFGFRVSGIGYQVSGIGYRVSGVPLRRRKLFEKQEDLNRVSCFVLRVSGFGLPVFGFQVWGLGFGVHPSGAVSVLRRRRILIARCKSPGDRAWCGRCSAQSCAFGGLSSRYLARERVLY